MDAPLPPISKRKQIEEKRAVVLRELAVDSDKLRAAVDACLAVSDACTYEEATEHLAKLLGRTRTEKGTRLALREVVAKYMGLYETDEQCWTEYSATKGGFKDWKKDFKRFMDAWNAGWNSGEISKKPLRPLKDVARGVDFARIGFASTSTAPDIPTLPPTLPESTLERLGFAAMAAPTELNSSGLAESTL